MDGHVGRRMRGRASRGCAERGGGAENGRSGERQDEKRMRGGLVHDERGNEEKGGVRDQGGRAKKRDRDREGGRSREGGGEKTVGGGHGDSSERVQHHLVCWTTHRWQS